ncbi:hypothetical protein ACFO6R_13325 [Eubacterium multiforme]|uniref:SinR family protein n=1 Tax=Eubacterium multiforme TaxID=83339 RepID=A0ABT9UXX5_9FIRM|nr:hypothetical protein [Eubacterium multiforme]MDQ0151175.1 hypothetical protein [Eubacterium multiforme]
MVYSVTYDLNKTGQNYSKLYDALRSFPSWCHCVDSTWLIESYSDSKTIYEKLSPCLDSNDYILIIKVAKEYYGWLPSEAWDWIASKV